jgi:hypothetical protein
MTIADKLTSINNSKTAIKNAIETKGVTVGSAPLADYASKILEIEGGGGPVFPDPEPTPWVRPEDWLPMPEILETEDKIGILCAVWDDTQNFVRFIVNCATASGITGQSYSVDWGDGVIETFAGNTSASHFYDYSNIPEGTLSSRGYRQVLITITPSDPGHTISIFNSGNLQGSAPFASDGVAMPFLDISISSTNESKASVTISTDPANGGNNYCPYLERVKIISDRLKAGPSQFISFSYSLRVLEWPGSLEIPTSTSPFSDCYNLEEILPITATGGSTGTLFQNCNSLKRIGKVTIDRGASTISLGATFRGCSSLVTLPEFELLGTGNISALGGTGTSGLLNGCSSLKIANLSFLEGRVTTALSLGNMFFGCASLLEVVLPVSGINVTSLQNTFESTGNLSKVTGGKMRFTGNVNFSRAFFGCGIFSIDFFDGIPDAIFLDAAFNGCRNLEHIPQLNTTQNTSFSGTFANCNSLKSIDWDIDCSKTTAMSSMFSGCSSLRNAPVLINVNAGSTTVTAMNAMFNNCYSMESVPLFDTSKTANVATMFGMCRNLTEIPAFNFAATSSAVNGTYLAAGTSSTSRGLVTRRIRVTGNRFAHNVRSMNLDANALNEVFTGLGTASGSQAITITNNPGAATCDRSIATAKGWTVTG